MKNKVLRTTAIFRCIVTLKNGAHRIVRTTIDNVAKLNAALLQYRDFGLLNNRYSDFMKELGLAAYDVLSCKVINERTGQELMTI
jgi:hypothetical protein